MSDEFVGMSLTGIIYHLWQSLTMNWNESYEGGSINSVLRFKAHGLTFFQIKSVRWEHWYESHVCAYRVVN